MDGQNTRLGVRVFKPTESNFRQWEPVDPEDPDRLIEQMGLFVDPLADDLFVCRHVALSDDPAANPALQCRLKTI